MLHSCDQMDKLLPKPTAGFISCRASLLACTLRILRHLVGILAHGVCSRTHYRKTQAWAISIPRTGFEKAIPVSDRPKTLHYYILFPANPFVRIILFLKKLALFYNSFLLCWQLNFRPDLISEYLQRSARELFLVIYECLVSIPL